MVTQATVKPNDEQYDELPPLLTVREFARIAGISHSVAYRMDERGELPTFGTGSRRVVKAQAMQLLGLESSAP